MINAVYKYTYLLTYYLLTYLLTTVYKTARPILLDHCLSVLSVTLVYCGQVVGWIKMPLGMEVGLGSGHIVLNGDPAPPLKKGAQHPQFSTHICCSQTAGWIKMPLASAPATLC